MSPSPGRPDEGGRHSRRVAARSGFWSLVLQLSRFGLNSIVFFVLARWLTLEEIGAFAIAFAPVTLAQTTHRGGFSETIVQDRDRSPAFASTVFWMSMAVGLALGLALFAASFLLEPVFGVEAAGAYLAAMSVVPVLVGISAVPEGLLRRRLEIRALALRTTASLTLAGAAALWLGHAGYGGWALTGFSIANTFFSTVFALALAGWRPREGFDRAHARAALAPVTFISARGLVGSAALPLLQMLVGLGLGPSAAGALQIAQRVLTLAATVTLTPIRFAILPFLARVDGDAQRFDRIFVETLGLTNFVMAPVYFGLMAVAPALLPLVVGAENGTAAAPVVQALLLVGGSAGALSIYMQALTVTGGTGGALRWSAAALALNAAVALGTMWVSGAAAALGYSLVGYALLPSLVASMSRAFGIDRRRLWRGVLVPVLIAAAMALGVLALGLRLSQVPPLPRVAVQVAAGGAVYLAVSALLNRTQVRTAARLATSLLPSRGG